MNINKRPDWDDIWMELAQRVSERSIDEKWKVGCIIVTEDNTSVLGVGYNGMEKGGKNCRDSMEPGKAGTIHAEANALLKFNYADVRKKKMYITCSPCIVCARMIINGDVSEVVYGERFRESCDESIELLKSKGIVARQYNNQQKNRHTF